MKAIKSLLSVDTNAKTVKGQKFGYMTGILYLAPSDEAGRGNLCPQASEGCRAACLFTAGRGIFEQVRQPRINKTLFWFENREAFMNILIADIKKLVKTAAKKGLIPCVRLNGTSDIPWENVKVDGQNLMEIFPSVQFYDYTKSSKRAIAFSKGEFPKNYSLTFSRAENNGAVAELVAKLGVNVAAVFKTMPEKYLGIPVINGDESDLRFLDPSGVIVGLKAKGKARKDTSGFVIV